MSFAQALDFLNKAQRQAVDKVYGPVLVLAGPGTGKTQMLTVRIANLLQKTDANPNNILCLTFTESATVEMRNRLQKWIGPAAYQVRINTFHGFCQYIMERYPEFFAGKLQNKEIADDLPKALAYRAAIKTKKWEFFSSVWDEFFAQRDVLSAISNLKREGVSPDKLRELIPAEKERLESDPDNFYKKKYRDFAAGDWKPQKKRALEQKIRKMYELVDLWKAYEEQMQKSRIYDFDDQINWVVTELQTNEALRLDLQEQFQWILVDEYQDTNDAQNSILWALTDEVEQPNIFAVGDDDQSIYRFQGASVANVQEFRRRFPNRAEITLETNYRSLQPILDAAYASVALNTERANADKKLVAFRQRDKKFELKDEKLLQSSNSAPIKNSTCITKASFGSRYSEVNWLVHNIREALAKGVEISDIAILVRKNREIAELTRELPKFDLRVQAQVFQNIFDNEAVRILILMLEVFSDEKYDEKLFDLLHSEFLGIAPEVLLELSLRRRSAQKSIIEVLLASIAIKDVSEEKSEKQLDLFTATQSAKADNSKRIEDENLTKFFHFFITARQRFHHLRPGVLAEKLLYESGMAEWMTAQNRNDDWHNIRKLLDWIREQGQKQKAKKQPLTLRHILEVIEQHELLDIKIKPDVLPRDKQAIQIMTAHKSKGLEFEVVFIPGLEDKAWGNPRPRTGIALPTLVGEEKDKDADNEEERRLFFVALTRAKSQLYLSYSKTDWQGREKNPSIFWYEIPEHLAEEIVSDELEEEVQKLLPVFLSGQEKTFTRAERSILQERVKNFIWSASSLQNYLDCPRRFLYQNLYRFPRRPLPYLALGVALHQALERWFKAVKSQQITTSSSMNVLLDEYNNALKDQNLPKADFEKWLNHGREVLEYYYQNRLQDLSQTDAFGYEIEYDFKAHHPTIDGIRITGKMDKVVYLDEDKKRAKIVDYKSGKPRPIKPGERLWRQLVFYDLLAKYSQNIQWQVDVCELDFLTPDSAGKLGIKTLEVTESDRQQVIVELKEAHEKLLKLEFPIVPNPTGDKDIEFWNNFGQ